MPLAFTLLCYYLWNSRNQRRGRWSAGAPVPLTKRLLRYVSKNLRLRGREQSDATTISPAAKERELCGRGYEKSLTDQYKPLGTKKFNLMNTATGEVVMSSDIKPDEVERFNANFKNKFISDKIKSLAPWTVALFQWSVTGEGHQVQSDKREQGKARKLKQGEGTFALMDRVVKKHPKCECGNGNWEQFVYGNLGDNPVAGCKKCGRTYDYTSDVTWKLSSGPAN